MNAIPAIPPLQQSAATALHQGFAALDKSAAEIVSAATLPTDINDTRPGIQISPNDAPTQDPLLTGVLDSIRAQTLISTGVLDSIRAQTLISTGVTLLHTYQHNTDTLMSLLDPDPRIPNFLSRGILSP